MTQRRLPRLVGGRLCLDFANTANWRGQTVVEEKLASPADVVAWASHAGLGQIAPGPGDAGGDLATLRALRADLRRLFVAAARGAPAPRAPLGRLNRLLAARGARLRLALAAGRLRHGATRGLMDAVGLPVAVSALDLLTSADLDRVKLCPAADCEWLFLDDSRNGTRRWCSMAECGNRAKVRLHYERSRGGPSGSVPRRHLRRGRDESPA